MPGALKYLRAAVLALSGRIAGHRRRSRYASRRGELSHARAKRALQAPTPKGSTTPHCRDHTQHHKLPRATPPRDTNPRTSHDSTHRSAPHTTSQSTQCKTASSTPFDSTPPHATPCRSTPNQAAPRRDAYDAIRSRGNNSALHHTPHTPLIALGAGVLPPVSTTPAHRRGPRAVRTTEQPGTTVQPTQCNAPPRATTPHSEHPHTTPPTARCAAPEHDAPQTPPGRQGNAGEPRSNGHLQRAPWRRTARRRRLYCEAARAAATC